MGYSDSACTTAVTSETMIAFDMTCRTNPVLAWHAKGQCTMDADGNMVTGETWQACSTNACDDGDSLLCPTEGVNMLGQHDCETDENGQHWRWICADCNNLPAN